MARLGELLVKAGALTVEQLDVALQRQQRRGGRLGSHLVELGMLSESALTRTLAGQLRLPAVSAAALEQVPPDVLRLIPRDTAAHHRAIPVHLEGTQLWVAMTDPTDSRAIRELEAATHLKLRPMVAPDLLLSYALERHYGVSHHRRVDLGPPTIEVDLRIDTDERAAVLAAGATVPTPYDDPFTPSQRAALDSRVLDLDERRVAGPTILDPLDTSAPGVSRTTDVFAARPRSQGRLGAAALGARLVGASSQREVFEAALAFIVQDFERAAVLVLRNGRLAGFLSGGSGIDETAVSMFSAPQDAIPVLGRAMTDWRPRLGRASDETLGELAEVMGSPAERPALILPLRCGQESVGLLVALGGYEGVEQYIEEYQSCGRKLNLALQVLLLRKRILEI